MKTLISTLMIGAITTVAAMSTMAAPAYDSDHHVKPHHVKKHHSMHQAGFKHIRAAKHIYKEENKSLFKKHHKSIEHDFRPDFRVMNKGPLPPQHPKS